MIFLLVILFFVAIIYAPSLWVRTVLKRHSQQRDDFPGTGGEFAEHLIERLGLEGVTVEASELGDAYYPHERVVRLSKDNFKGKSLTAVTVAAHEVGHAMQHAEGYAPLETRTRVAEWIHHGQRVGAGLLLLSPILVILLKIPAAGVLSVVGGFLILGLAAFLHFLTLPVELDASFKRALPILESGYISETDYPAAKQILRAAAFTYVASAMTTLVNIWAWLRVLRR